MFKIDPNSLAGQVKALQAKVDKLEEQLAKSRKIEAALQVRIDNYLSEIKYRREENERLR